MVLEARQAHVTALTLVAVGACALVETEANWRRERVLWLVGVGAASGRG